MTQPERTPSSSSKMIWTGRILSGVPILFLLFSGGAKLAQPAPLLEAMGKFGYPQSTLLGIGIVELLCTVLYAIPRTSVLGAILLTGYLGGATATHVRIGDPFVIPVLLGVAIWLGLWCRDERVRRLAPLRSSEAS